LWHSGCLSNIIPVNIAVFVGTVKWNMDGIGEVIDEYEYVARENSVALFVPVKYKVCLESFLSDRGFTPLDIPDDKGNPGATVRNLELQKQKLEEKLEEVQERLAKLREKHAAFILEAEDFLSVEVEKAEAPLRFATTEHSFIIDGWIPKDDVNKVKNGLAGVGDLYIEHIESDKKDAPVLLDNPKPSKPYELLINLFSTPSYKELDPTLFVSLIFPVFFGFMIGDAGYGIVMIGLGFLMWKKLESIPALQDLGLILLTGGIFALTFGLFVYGEAFAIPFHAAVGHSEIPTVSGAESWSIILGWEVPLYPVIHKLENIVDLLLLSVIGALVHLGIGYIFGIINEVKHDKKHAVAKLGWLIILFGLFLQLMIMASYLAMEGGNPVVHGTRVGNFVMDRILFFVPTAGMVFSGMTISFVSLGCIITGILLFVPVEGPMAVMEIIGLTANVLSYTRLAGIAVAKGAVAVAFNVMLLPLLFSGNIALIIMGCIFIFLAHAMVLILGALASGIQTLRLNYVEFFLKFYEGAGSLFKPFGKREASQ
jgi:V/A-type H+-transporting ATPase subunit I